tara:strand:- start:99 stop:344 length:246 start_codon:yes stop_codon:yes gene_type:complete
MAAERIHDLIDLYRFKELNDTFTGICTLMYDRDTVFVKGLHGTYDFADRTELKEYLASKGIHKASYVKRRNGKDIYRTIFK